MVPTTAARNATRNHRAAEATKDFLDLTTGNYRMWACYVDHTGTRRLAPDPSAA
jgi:hypothetical protein